LTSREGVHWEDALTKTTPPEAALWGARNARVTLMSGVTTCRDMGSTWPFVDVELRKAIEAGAVPGPRLLVAGSYVSSTGGAGDARQFSIYLDVPLVRNLADGPEEIVKAVRTNFRYGADFIKILVTGAVLSKGIPPGAQQYSDVEIQAAVTGPGGGDGRLPRTLMAPRGSRRQFVPDCGLWITAPIWTMRQWRC
jgi:imidazolonepropionase-like amidohydrolase